VAAEEAIKLCRSSQRSVFEAIAQGILARALLRRDGLAARAAVESALDNAAQLIDQTGASSLAIALLEWRAELARAVGNDDASEALLNQAKQGYKRIGSPKQVQRLEESRHTT